MVKQIQKATLVTYSEHNENKMIEICKECGNMAWKKEETWHGRKKKHALYVMEGAKQVAAKKVKG